MRPLIISVLAAVPICAQVVLSEIMFDLEASDNPNEFVECFNLSSHDTVDLAQWKIADLWSSDGLVDAGKGTRLPPLSYVVIFEGDYDMEEGIYANLVPETALIVKVDDTSIGNQLSGEDSLFLTDENGDTVDRCGWENISAPGFSLERRRLDQPGGTSNWETSRDSLGTPGLKNSVTPHPIDAALREEAITHAPRYPDPNEAVELYVIVYNLGTESFGGSLRVTENGESLAFTTVDDLSEEDSVTIALTLPPLLSGIHTVEIAVQVPGDGNPANNAATYELIVRFTERLLVLNEIHYEPDTGVPEFMELFNLGDVELTLANWAISDSGKRSLRILPGGTVPPGGYAVISEDSSLLPYLPLDGILVVPENGFPSLNNDGDALYLLGPAGTVIDSLTYTSSWGGGHGRSLEKLNPVLDSWAESSWGTCVALEKMTPGSQNSIFIRSLPSSGSIKLEPNPFSPDGDGYQDVIHIAYSLPFSQAYLTVLIFDSEGRNVRTLARNLATGSEGAISWDGLSYLDRRARIGIYVVKISAVDAESKRSMEWVKTAVLAEPLSR
ncbi:MAG: lamin tail domain-containing protein [Candidatus Neomarinimicrobiota bacterium]